MKKVFLLLVVLLIGCFTASDFANISINNTNEIGFSLISNMLTAKDLSHKNKKEKSILLRKNLRGNKKDKQPKNLFVLDSVVALPFVKQQSKKGEKFYLYPLPSKKARQYYSYLNSVSKGKSSKGKTSARKFKVPERFEYYKIPSTPDSIARFKRNIIATAEKFLGVPYRWGGINPEKAFDCSGFVWYVFNMLGVKISRGGHDQSFLGTEVDVKDARAGDLVFFGRWKQEEWVTTHVGIVMSYNNGQLMMIHASRGGVKIEDALATKYYKKRFLFVRRLL